MKTLLALCAVILGLAAFTSSGAQAAPTLPATVRINETVVVERHHRSYHRPVHRRYHRPYHHRRSHVTVIHER